MQLQGCRCTLSRWPVPVSEGVIIPISERDLEDYRQGLRDRDLQPFEQVINDITRKHPESEAYYAGRRGEQLDQGNHG